MDCASALVKAVDPQSPADAAGIKAGHALVAVDGFALRDIIDWRWLADGAEAHVSYLDDEGCEHEAVLERTWGQDWGIEFADIVFDGIRECRNACTFCFMRQLPEGARPSLSLRDDDYRLSFLQGNFVTFTNLRCEDEQRIIEQRISPLRFSLHAVTPEVREGMIGKHAAAGLAAAERLLDAGIELHAQIVLMPSVNDGEELVKTLEWAWRHAGIKTVGIVPLGYTKHQKAFTKSFNGREEARKVLSDIEPFQQRSAACRGEYWAWASDEFYRNAYPETLLEELPPASAYGSFDMFEDGIGIIRSFVDDWKASASSAKALAEALGNSGKKVAYVVGYAQREFLIPLIDASPLAGMLVPLPVENRYFGGNVDVTGLLCGEDIINALNDEGFALQGADLAVVPEVVFNACGMTLDDMSVEDVQAAVDIPLRVVSCNASEYFGEIASLIESL